ncbi:3-carboxy-cis,cis-muconate cycloisomerase [Rhizobium sp. LjRoot30]|uniref:3-carboxy-cis,cis-muconate cycloisomerase n=1 Tax=Rhizobium sp. LjRoot30 TaxID=3342320 RepID=UPI003ECC37ED
MTELLSSFLDELLGDVELARLIGTTANCAAMLRFELALARAEADHGLIPQVAASEISAAAASFKPDLALLRQATLKDGVVVPEFVRQLRLHVGEPAGRHIHFGATSQDVIDTALALKLKPVLALFDMRLQAVIAHLDALASTFGKNPVMGRTRMQAAIPITAADRIAVWRDLIMRAKGQLEDVCRQNLIVSLAGPAGTAEKFGGSISGVRQGLASALELSVPDYVPHAARDRIAGLGNWLSQVTGALGKVGQDIALMAQNEIAEVVIEGAGGSSAMAHKQNPVRAEVLVTLARFNAVQLSGLHQALVHEQERSGAAWTLEWMILPQMLNATGTALLHAQNLLASITRLGTVEPD